GGAQRHRQLPVHPLLPVLGDPDHRRGHLRHLGPDRPRPRVPGDEGRRRRVPDAALGPGVVTSDASWPERGRRLARWLNPVVASPAAPLETFAALDALSPSLMPRTSRLQGVAMGLSVLGARATTSAAERLTSVVVPPGGPRARQRG